MAERGSASSAHAITPVEVHVNGDLAVSESTGSIMARFEYGKTLYDCVSYGRFVSRLRREESEWKILTLEVIYDKDAIQPVTPKDSKIPVDISSNARSSYRCLAWVLAQNGFSIDCSLPGTDQPGSGDALMKSSFDWLYKGQ